MGITAFIADWRTALISIAAMVIGLYGSYAFGSGQLSASDPVRGSRQAFRQVVTHYGQLGALEQMVADEGAALAQLAGDDGRVPIEHVDRSLYHIGFQLTQQLSTAKDVIANWEDFLPDEGPKAEGPRKQQEAGR